MHRIRTAAAAGVITLLLAAGCASSSGEVSASGGPTTTATVPAGTGATSTTASETSTTVSADATTTTAAPVQRGAMGLYPERVYVPNTRANTVQVIDPATCEIVNEFATRNVPHHITPSWDLSVLYVFNTEGNSLTVIDPATAEPIDEISVEDPYNLYFRPDGSEAIVVAERFRRLDFRDPQTWELIETVPVDPPGVDHLAFSRDGSYLVASTEFSGFVAKVDLDAYAVDSLLEIGGAPIDVVRDPVDDHIMYVANQELHGVHVIDADAMVELDFVPAGTGSHGLLLSKDKTQMFVSNRLDGSISVFDLASRSIVDTWDVGGSPDMGLLNPDGTEIWISNRYDSSVSAINASTGVPRCVIPTDPGPHGVTYFPTPGIASIGHNGLMIDENGDIE
jgi:YVTN family beta-propeller protein